jgi:predicted aspartyl protease
MSTCRVELSAINPKEEEKRTLPMVALVDTGSELSWLPKQALLDIGITPRQRMRFFTADGKSLERDIGYVILEAEGYATSDDVIFGEEGDMSLLGVRTIEGFGVMVDNVGQRFVAAANHVPANYRIGRVL